MARQQACHRGTLPIEENCSSKRIACFTLVEPGIGSPSQIDVFEPIQGKKTSFIRPRYRILPPEFYTLHYGPLNGVARNKINLNFIAQHWDDLLRLAGSLKLGVVQATSITRTLQIGDRPTKLAQAVAELGRIDKTIHCLTYIDDESKRRRTLNQLNRSEDRHKLARAVFHGRRGELRQRYREGQEDQLSALG